MAGLSDDRVDNVVTLAVASDLVSSGNSSHHLVSTTPGDTASTPSFGKAYLQRMGVEKRTHRLLSSDPSVAAGIRGSSVDPQDVRILNASPGGVPGSAVRTMRRWPLPSGLFQVSQ